MGQNQTPLNEEDYKDAQKYAENMWGGFMKYSKIGIILCVVILVIVGLLTL